MRNYLIPAALLLWMTNAALLDILQSKLEIDYFILGDDSGSFNNASMVEIAMSVSNYDLTNWTATDGSMGLWMGFGIHQMNLTANASG